MKKTLMIIGGFVVGCLILAVILVSFTAATSKKMKCKSDEGSITLMYKKGKLVGYTAKNIKFDLDGQKEIAEQIGIENYLDEFEQWFEENTTGTCKR